MEYLSTFMNRYFSWLTLPSLNVIDIIEIIILAFAIYTFLRWIKDTKAWNLLKGLIVVAIFIALAEVLQMTVIIWIFQKVVSILAISAVIVFQPEIRRALEKLGEKNLIAAFIPINSSRNDSELFTEHIVNELVEASFEMGRNKTGALIVVERTTRLSEVERTGIKMDSLISSQLILNIFEHNTPLHDGAAIVRGDRIVSATCYLPLSENRSLSKELGTRHRAGLGISEISDALVIIVSEETGLVSLASDGKLDRGIDEDTLREKLNEIRNLYPEKRKFKISLKGQDSHEKETDK